MNTTSLRRALVPGITAATLALAISACGAANEQNSGSDGEGTLSGTLKGGGASSQEKGQAAWVAGIQDANPDLSVVYEPVGSGSGREGFITGGYLFAGTDSALNDDEGELTKAKEQCGADPIQVPGYVSPIAVVFNVEGVDELNLDPKTIADIFAGKITKWNDPAIAATNPDAKLPDTAITPVHRSDDSGTQENFTEYLAAAGGWAEEPSGEWPASIKGGEGGDGTSGVVTAMQGAGYIGFMDESAARENDLATVKVKVGEDFVEPTAEAAAKILAASEAGRHQRQRHGRRGRPHDHRGRRLPGRAGLLPAGLPDLRERRGRGQREGLPGVHPLRGRPGGRRRGGRLRAARP